MPKVESMEMAIHVATEFVSKYHPFRQVRGGKKDSARGVWCVEFAVGKDSGGKATVCVDSADGAVVEYQSWV